MVIVFFNGKEIEYNWTSKTGLTKNVRTETERSLISITASLVIVF